MSFWLLPSMRILTGSALFAGLGTYLYGTRVESRRFQLDVVRLTIGQGQSSLKTETKKSESQLRILHLSDLHLCYPESHKVEFIKRVTDDDYDLVVLTGDVFEDYSGLVYASSLLSRRPSLGAYAVLGNHDYYNYQYYHKLLGRIIKRLRHPAATRDVRPMIEALEGSGITVLRNQATNHPERKVHIVGIDYPTIHREHLAQLTAHALPEDIVLVLFHLPINLDNISKSGAHLALGGHTHGGQICIPGLGAIITDSELPRSEASGLFCRGATTFHISRGLGADPRTNFRFFCPPAATVLEVTY